MAMPTIGIIEIIICAVSDIIFIIAYKKLTIGYARLTQVLI